MITDVFPNPTVVNVIFQIRFPNLFYLENRIGDYQLRIMDRFPESRLLQQRNVVVARLSADGKVENLPEEVKPGEVIKVWQFLSKTGVQLNVTSDSLSLSSEKHKTYKNSVDSDERFRDAIEFAVNNFLAIMPFPLITRIGLRYVDNCPLSAATNEAYSEYYNSALPLSRFAVSDALILECLAQVRRKGFFVTFRESYRNESKVPQLMFDFDAYAENVASEKYLNITDKLHDLVVAEYEASVKSPLIDYMRQPRKDKT
jgi:uncharacterized protein (TIGR04255 family)